MGSRGALLDTGVIVALVNADDPDHDASTRAWAEHRGPLVTVEGVLVEAAHLLRRERDGITAVLGLVRAAGVEVVMPSSERYDRAAELVRKYRDVPMDLVDALLVALAEERRLTDILTLDLRGFATYRIRGRGRFRIRPG